MSEKKIKKKEVKAPEKIVIDAEGCTMGRIASFAAKQGLNGKRVVIFNAEKALISGKSASMFADYKERHDAVSQSNPIRYGPHRPKDPDRFMRRAIRGMLPWGKPRGRDAFKKVMVYMGRPENEIMKREHVDLSKAKMTEVPGSKRHYDYFVTVGELCKYLGGKNE